MEKNNYKVIAVLALVISVLALSVGFASYTATLTIEGASATATASDTFSPHVEYQQNSLSCVRTGTQTSVSSAGQLNSASHATTWSGAAVTLSGPGDSVTCTATIDNNSTFTAYLKSIQIGGALTCAPAVQNATLQNLTAACDTIDLTVTMGSASATSDTTGATNATVSNGAVSIATTQSEDVSFTIAYPANSPVTDGDFTITIPTITLNFETVS